MTTIYHMWKHKSNVATYKQLKDIFTREYHFCQPMITVNTYNLLHYDDKKIKTGINFEQGDSILVIELEDILTLREKQLYLALHCWAYFHNLAIAEVIYLIKEAIKNQYNIMKKRDIIAKETEARYAYSMEMFNTLLKKLPSEIALEYFVRYEIGGAK